MKYSLSLGFITLLSSVFAQTEIDVSTDTSGSSIINGVTYSCGSPAEIGVYNGLLFCCVNGKFIGFALGGASPANAKSPAGVGNRDIGGRNLVKTTAAPALNTDAPIFKRTITSSLEPGFTCVGDAVSTPTIVSSGSPSGSSSKNAAAAMKTQVPMLAAGGFGLAVAYGAM